MKQVIVGGVEQSSISIISKYLETVYNNLDFKVLAEQGIAGIVSRGITNPDVILIVLASDTYNNLKSKVKTLGHAKVYKFTSDSDLEDYCRKMVGVEVSSEPVSKPVLPDEDMDLPPLQGVVEDSPIEITDFSAGSDYEATISRLTDENAQKDMLIRNLEQQLREIESGSADDEKELIAEIKRLNAEVDELKAQANNSSELDYNAKAKIEFAEKKIAELNDLKLKVDSYEIQISGYKTQVVDLTEENASLSSQVNDYSDEVSDLSNSVSELGKQLEAKNLELEAKLSELNILQEQLSNLSGVSANADALSQRVSELELEVKNKDLDIINLNQDIEVLKGQLSEKEALIAEKLNQIEVLQQQLEANNSTINSLQESNSELEAKTSKLESDLIAKSEENDLIREKITELRGKANSSAEMSEELKKALEEQEAELRKKEEEFRVKSEEFEKQKSEFDSLTQESSSNQVIIDKLLAEKQSLEDRLVSVTENNLTLDSSIKAKEQEILGYQGQIQDLETEKSKNLNTIESLQTQLASNKASNERIALLESDLLEEKRKNSNLSSELDIMKKIDDSGRVADLKVEVAQLKHKLSEASNNDADLRRYKERCTDLELQLAEYEVKGKASGVFTQMSNITLPKLAYDCKLEEISGLANNFICVASGSSESTSPTYHLLRKTCQKYRDKRCLIIDLSTDSYIDREFGTEKVVSPVDWLLGTQPFTNFVSNTRFNNVRVISTGLAYINDLCFLHTDWQNRLSELQGFADVVIIYIGCLNNMVTKVLFNTFNSCMRSFVITKATPINLRTVILTLTGLVNINQSLTTVGCVNFDATTSKSLYQKLASKYNAQIYSETDAITL